MTSIKFSGTFTFKNLDQPVQQLADSTMSEELDKYIPIAQFYDYQPVKLNWHPEEDTLEIQVYNRARILGRNTQGTLPSLDKRLKDSLDNAGIPYDYSTKLGAAQKAPHKKNWLQRTFSLKKRQTEQQN